VPAPDLERLIIAEWRSLLSAPDLDVQSEVDAPEISTLIRNAAQRPSDAWPEMQLRAQHHALLAAGLRVTVGHTQPSLSIARAGLLALREGPPQSAHRRGVTDDNTASIRTVDADACPSADKGPQIAAVTAEQRTPSPLQAFE
jgi:hypothetical protein